MRNKKANPTKYSNWNIYLFIRRKINWWKTHRPLYHHPRIRQQHPNLSLYSHHDKTLFRLRENDSESFWIPLMHSARYIFAIPVVPIASRRRSQCNWNQLHATYYTLLPQPPIHHALSSEHRTCVTERRARKYDERNTIIRFRFAVCLGILFPCLYSLHIFFNQIILVPFIFHACSSDSTYTHFPATYTDWMEFKRASNQLHNTTSATERCLVSGTILFCERKNIF